MRGERRTDGIEVGLDGVIGRQLRLDGVHCIKQRSNGRIQSIDRLGRNGLDGRMKSNCGQLLVQCTILDGLQIFCAQQPGVT